MRAAAARASEQEAQQRAAAEQVSMQHTAINLQWVLAFFWLQRLRCSLYVTIHNATLQHRLAHMQHIMLMSS